MRNLQKKSVEFIWLFVGNNVFLKKSCVGHVLWIKIIAFDMFGPVGQLIVHEHFVSYMNILNRKVAFSQKGLIRLSFHQIEKSDHFPELEFGFFFHSKWLKLCKIRTWSCSECSKKVLEQLSSPYLTWFGPFRMKKTQNSSSGK